MTVDTAGAAQGRHVEALSGPAVLLHAGAASPGPSGLAPPPASQDAPPTASCLGRSRGGARGSTPQAVTVRVYSVYPAPGTVLSTLRQH